jgi:hypothetical protein
MEKIVKTTVLALLCTLFTGKVCAQGWVCNPSDFENDMAVWLTVTVDDNAVTDLENYVVAAFVGTECRGVSEVVTSTQGTVLYLRIRSNKTAEEGITFQVYNKTEGRTMNSSTTINFTKDAVEGLPSSPFTVACAGIIPGDVNADGAVDIADAVCIVNHVVGKPNTTFIKAAADANNDGDVDIADAVHIVNFVVGKISSLARPAKELK